MLGFGITTLVLILFNSFWFLYSYSRDISSSAPLLILIVILLTVIVEHLMYFQRIIYLECILKNLNIREKLDDGSFQFKILRHDKNDIEMLKAMIPRGERIEIKYIENDHIIDISWKK